MPDTPQLFETLLSADLSDLMARASAVRDAGHGNCISFSRKVFIPLTQLCRDVCHYCTFAHPPRKGEAAYLSLDQVVEIARAGQKAGCREALFTLGDKPELRYRQARDELAVMGFGSTVEYLAAAADAVLRETGLLPHLNPGILTPAELALLRTRSVSMGIMLETSAERLSLKGGPHYGSPDKLPAVRMAMIEDAGRAQIPFTSGLLIGIGETRQERLEALIALRDSHHRHGHIQEIIIQNFRAKPGTRMANASEPPLEDLQWTIAAARLIFGPEMNIQTPPNLNAGQLEPLIQAGINDWGGVSPVTPDHVNPEYRWPELDALAEQTRAAGKTLVERTALYPSYARISEQWCDPAVRPVLLNHIDGSGLAREDGWLAGISDEAPSMASWGRRDRRASDVDAILKRAQDGSRLEPHEIARLLDARGSDVGEICAAADAMRAEAVGDEVTYVINRNINYTNICGFGCGFCAFSKSSSVSNTGRDKPYNLALDEIVARVAEAHVRGASEVCLQGGIHPSYTGQTYLDICHAIKAAVPAMHIHAFSPLEIWQGAQTLGIPVSSFLERLAQAGLGSLPGTAAEILVDDVRAVICPDKLDTASWLSVVETAHRVGLPTTSTMMFGHVETMLDQARHLLHLRDLQARTGGLTEFVPLPFVAQEAPLYRKGKTRAGPTFREALLVHAVARLTLSGLVDNIQTSWVKMGLSGAALCLQSGANDLGGVLMDESITRAAGARHGQLMAVEQMEDSIRALGRAPVRRNTLYGRIDEAAGEGVSLSRFEQEPEQHAH